MKRWIVVALLAGCQRSAPPVEDAYAADIVKVCNVLSLAGAENSPDQAYLVATWLGANLTTKEAREYLVRIQPLDGDKKADALLAEAHRVGMSDCAVAEVWRAPKP